MVSTPFNIIEQLEDLEQRVQRATSEAVEIKVSNRRFYDDALVVTEMLALAISELEEDRKSRKAFMRALSAKHEASNWLHDVEKGFYAV